MSEERGPRRGFGTLPLGVRVVVAGLAVTLLVLAGFAFVVGSSVRAGNELADATGSFADEARIADDVTLQLTDQITAASALRTGDDAELRAQFEGAGRQVQEQLRRYLFRDLTVDERQLLEAMSESHQLLEVAGLRSVALRSSGREEEARAAWAEMIGHTRAFLGRLDRILSLRRGRLDGLRDQQSRTFRTVTVASAGLGLLAVGAVVLLSWLLHRRVARPLDGLAEASARLGAGDLSVRVPSWEDPELDALSRTFNRMAANLEGTNRSLEDRNRELEETLDTLERTQDELIRSEKLGALGRMTAGLAHELNNPLTSVVGYGEILEEKLKGVEAGDADALEAARDELLDPIVREARRARHLIRNLLYFSRRSDVRVESVSLPETLDVVTELGRGGFENEGIELVRDEVPSTPVVAEPNLLQGVLLNLVNNALDAMRPRGRGTLRIRGEERGDNVWLHVEDDGPGMEEPSRAFDPFYTTKAPGEGTGLGLTLAHRFMEEFGGTIRAENRVEGGARIVLGFRKAREEDVSQMPSTAAADAELADEEAAGGAERAAPPSATPASAGNGSGAGEAPDRSELRILVVEDEEPIRTLHGRLLDRMDLRAHLVESAARAREVLSESRVDAVLCDVKMPGESGLEFYRWLEGAHPELTERFLFVTGDVSDPELVEIMEERPELFLHKPFDVQEYLNRVGAVVEGAR